MPAKSGYLTAFAAMASLAIVTLPSTSAFASSMSWTLSDSNGCGGFCNTGPFGTVTATETAPDTIHLSVDLTGTGYVFMSGAPVFAFNVEGVSGLTLSNFNPAFTDNGTPAKSDDSGFRDEGDRNFNYSAFGQFAYGISAGGGGGGNTQGQSLNFDIQATSGTLSLANILDNASGYSFALHLCPEGTCGGTGFAGGSSVTSVPLPAAGALLGVGVAGLVGLGRRRKKQAA